MGTNVDFQPEILIGQAATRDRIIEGILAHLGQAGSEDIALFYFSGHGIREKAPLAFSETNATFAIESLACYDSYANTQTFGLANKELRYLLHKATPHNPHLAVITDCCHSAAATRSGMMPIRRNAEPGGYDMLPARTWEHFAFARDISPDRPLSTQELEIQLPQARHLHLAACQAEQSAFEVGSEGVFTAHLLEVLRQSSGAVSYQQLRERSANLIRSRTRDYAQTPNIYQPKGSLLADTAFLGLEQRKSKIFVAVTQGERDIRINRGLIHGIPYEDNQEGIEISVFEANRPDTGEIASAKIWNTGISSSEIRLLEDTVLKKDCLYEAHIQGLYQRDFKVALWADGTEEADKQLVREAFYTTFQKEIDEKPGPNTDCVVVLHQNRITLAHPDSDYLSFDEAKYLPLVQQLNGVSKENIGQLMRHLQHIAQYELTRHISNRNSSLNPADFSLEIGIGTGSFPERPAVWDATNQYFNVRLGEPGSKQEANLFLSVKNQSNTQIYLSLMYLSQLFGANPCMLDQAAMSITLDPGRQAEEIIVFVLETFVQEFNLPYERGLFRLFAATEAFNLKGLEQDDLPAPTPTATKGPIERGPRVNRPQQADWIVVDYPIRFVNPYYREQ